MQPVILSWTIWSVHHELLPCELFQILLLRILKIPYSIFIMLTLSRSSWRLFPWRVEPQLRTTISDFLVKPSRTTITHLVMKSLLTTTLPVANSGSLHEAEVTFLLRPSVLLEPSRTIIKARRKLSVCPQECHPSSIITTKFLSKLGMSDNP